jgi:hypothetical protein
VFSRYDACLRAERISFAYFNDVKKRMYVEVQNKYEDPKCRKNKIATSASLSVVTRCGLSEGNENC